MKVVLPDEAGIAEAVRALRNGEIVAYPTETVYGLAVDPFSEPALHRLFEVKQRPETKPILCIVADENQLAPLVREVSDYAHACIAKFWPGPLSLLFHKQETVSPLLIANSEKICLRCPSCETARGLCTAFGGAITSSSANHSGTPPARSISDLDLDGITIAIDGGTLIPSPPSTVYDPDTGLIIREGAITADTLRAL